METVEALPGGPQRKSSNLSHSGDALGSKLHLEPEATWLFLML